MIRWSAMLVARCRRAGPFASQFWAGARLCRRAAADGEGVIGSAVRCHARNTGLYLGVHVRSTASQYDTRRQLLFDELNSIGTSDLRVDVRARSQSVRAANSCSEATSIFEPTPIRRRKPCKAASCRRVRRDPGLNFESSIGKLSPRFRIVIPLSARCSMQSIYATIDLHTSRATGSTKFSKPPSSRHPSCPRRMRPLSRLVCQLGSR